MTDRMVRRFKLKGVVGDDSKFLQVKETYKATLIEQMRDAGYVPVLDLDPSWKTHYLDSKYECEYIMQGVFVGVEVAWKSAGIVGAKIIPKNKLKAS